MKSSVSRFFIPVVTLILGFGLGVFYACNACSTERVEEQETASPDPIQAKVVAESNPVPQQGESDVNGTTPAADEEPSAPGQRTREQPDSPASPSKENGEAWPPRGLDEVLLNMDEMLERPLSRDAEETFLPNADKERLQETVRSLLEEAMTWVRALKKGSVSKAEFQKQRNLLVERYKTDVLPHLSPEGRERVLEMKSRFQRAAPWLL